MAAAPVPLSPADSLALAREFAPTLVFHPSEGFFPTSALLPDECLVETPSCARAAFGRGIRTRIRDYLAMSLDRKMLSATAYFRAVRTRAGQVVLEYWFYYLNNPYRIRGGLVPFWLDGSHAHDLERIVMMLEELPDASKGAAPARRYAVRTALASAHSAGVPGNRYDFRPDRPAPGPLQFLVELGSHAMAPDVDGDNVFDPAIDATGGHKFIWGIRDRGNTWARYRTSYADDRQPPNAVCIAGRGAATSETRPTRGERCFPYRLAPLDDFQQVAAAGLSAAEQRAALGRVGWLRRLFVGDPSSGVMENGEPDRREAPTWLVQRVAAADRAFAVGFSNIRSAGTLLTGARYAWLNESTYVPDVLVDAGLMFTTDGRRLYEVSGFGFYPVDAISKVLAGTALRSVSADGRRLDWMAGTEFSVGRWRVRVVARNPHRDLWIESRVYYLF